MKSGEFTGHVKTLNSNIPQPSLNNVCSVVGAIILLKEAIDIREHQCHEWEYLDMQVFR